MSWKDVKPTPYEDLPEFVEMPGILSSRVRICREILYDHGWHNETRTTTLERAINYRAELLARQIDDEMMGE